ncbi:hypothetical protein DASC09_030100 [Saccharomycopsis crataegensis]|uniref:Uncharacterized protein n=1 Tax=Saccharomycopsis crataegensis TaxID=43959 RepID=A0AAV5QMC0_9ASCO|nr:hypothetical protein DASC09_030100 [Saccharomycopsis crataegensis]
MTDSCIQAGVDLELFFETCDQANGFLIEPGECDKCGPDSQWGVIVYFAVNVEVTKIRGHYLPNCRPKTVSFKCQFDKLFKVGLPEEDTATKAFLLMEMTSDNEDMKRQAISLLGLDTELAFCGSSKPTASHTIDIDNLYLKRIQDISTEWDASELSQTFLNFGEQLKLYAGTENNHKRRRLDDE